MLVGFMQRPLNPTKLAKVTAMMSSHYGIDLIYLRPNDIDTKNGKVTGKMYNKGKWVSVNKNLPPIFDISSKCFKEDTEELMDYLRNNTVLTFDKKGTPNKEQLQKELIKDSNFAHLVIPTRTLDSFATLEEFLEEYSFIIMKPLYGSRGRGLYSLRKKGNRYILAHRENEKEISSEELLEHYKLALSKKKYILQKFVDSRTKNDYPFDCRVQVQKNGKGKWVIAKIFFRIGIGQKVMSNVHQGGGISDPEPFLKSNFGKQWEKINQKIEELAKTLPYKIEDIKGTPTMDLGFDVGIDKSGELYLFESNNGATKKPLIAESAMLRVEYYRYIIKTHPELIKLKETNSTKSEISKFKILIKNLQDRNTALLEEREQYRNKLFQMKQSKSWRLTSPMRKIFKKITNKETNQN